MFQHLAHHIHKDLQIQKVNIYKSCRHVVRNTTNPQWIRSILKIICMHDIVIIIILTKFFYYDYYYLFYLFNIFFFFLVTAPRRSQISLSLRPGAVAPEPTALPARSLRRGAVASVATALPALSLSRGAVTLFCKNFDFLSRNQEVRYTSYAHFTNQKLHIGEQPCFEHTHTSIYA